MNKYEIMFIVKTTIDEAEAKNSATTLKSVITDMKGEIIEFKEIGAKTLSLSYQKRNNWFLLSTCL